MSILLRLWGLAIIGIGGYSLYRLIDSLFIQKGITTLSTFFIILCLLGILVSITLIWGGFKLLFHKRG